MHTDYRATNADAATIENIRTMVNRAIAFFEVYGKPQRMGFTFEPPVPDEDAYDRMYNMHCGTYGGYTPTVGAGDGDFLTADTLWDFKVSVKKPTSKHRLQVLMYWIMGQHSGQEIYKEITRIGLFNPRLNAVYLLDVDSIALEIIEAVERDVICYPQEYLQHYHSGTQEI